MNWYKESQTYEDIMQYPDEYDDGNLNAHRYFSIGQNETQDDSFCWIWVNNQLHVAEGPTTHGAAFGYMFEKIREVDDYYRGWYDPTQNMLSVVTIDYKEGIQPTEESLPSPLRRSLYRKFGQDIQMVLF
jgi:hypothetical protein